MFTLPPAHHIASLVSQALAEDIGQQDWTALLIDAATPGHARVIAREAATICGQAWFDEAFRQVDGCCQVQWLVAEGQHVAADTVLCQISGPARALLTAERTALNLLQTLSAVASETRRYADLVAGTRARILDTRKTLPGMRLAQKYAVTVGGGVNQRIGLYDGILIKENHIMAAAELQEALDAGCTLILLDNMSLDDMREAVRLSAGRALLEASGGVDFSTVRAIADTGVDRISIGKLTKDVRAIDLSMRFSQ